MNAVINKFDYKMCTPMARTYCRLIAGRKRQEQGYQEVLNATRQEYRNGIVCKAVIRHVGWYTAGYQNHVFATFTFEQGEAAYKLPISLTRYLFTCTGWKFIEKLTATYVETADGTLSDRWNVEMAEDISRIDVYAEGHWVHLEIPES